MEHVRLKHGSDDAIGAIGDALFRPTGVDGLRARTGLFEQVIEAINGLISRHREPETEILRFPPIMSRHHVEKSGYLKSFPHLLGCVSCLAGEEADIRRVVERANGNGDW